MDTNLTLIQKVNRKVHENETIKEQHKMLQSEETIALNSEKGRSKHWLSKTNYRLPEGPHHYFF